ncbi:hypothetical protein CFC21_007800 [Triticum aestivum]|uniref:Uncharacterized protein n=2 Tax=Triticum aestivum TaxID=4565 RepID=A0A9R1DEX5_WHEAT|nr:hypothetical protein CFC21_007796 [Triticum aestivum]KAF6990630.1 hypothetical protein CFC21_007800 [Triticum aestivum]
MKCLYACGRSKRRTTAHTAPTGASIACTTAEQHCPVPAACSWCRATSPGTAPHDAACAAAFHPAPTAATRARCGADGRDAVYGIIHSRCTSLPLSSSRASWLLLPSLW